MVLIPIFSESFTTIPHHDHTGHQKFMAEDIYCKNQNINYQKMYHEFKMKNWIWLWMNSLFPEVKAVALRKLSQFIVTKHVNPKYKENKIDDDRREDENRIDKETWEAIDLYVDYLQLAILLETQDESVTFPHYPVTLLDDLLPTLKDILPGPDKIEITHSVISTFSKKLLESTILSTTISSELIVQILNEYFTSHSYTFDQTVSFYIEMVKY